MSSYVVKTHGADSFYYAEQGMGDLSQIVKGPRMVSAAQSQSTAGGPTPGLWRHVPDWCTHVCVSWQVKPGKHRFDHEDSIYGKESATTNTHGLSHEHLSDMDEKIRRAANFNGPTTFTA